MATLLFALYVAFGFYLYRRRWPEGLFPRKPNPAVDRLRRVSRKRVAPHGGEERVR